MDKNKKIQEKIKKKWIKKLHIKEFSPIYIIQITEKDKMDRIKWNCVQKCWEISLNKDSREMVIAHELGHLYFPKKVNDLRLLPKLAKPEKKEELNRMIHKLLNPLVDNFVDHYLRDIDNFYNFWLEQKRKNLENGIYLGNFKGVVYRIGDFMCEYLNYHYILKEEDADHWLSKIEDRLNQIEKFILRIKNFTKTDLKLLKNKLNQFKELRYIRDSEKILLFLHEIITEIGKILNIKYWDKSVIAKQFDIIFNFPIPKKLMNNDIL